MKLSNEIYRYLITNAEFKHNTLVCKVDELHKRNNEMSLRNMHMLTLEIYHPKVASSVFLGLSHISTQFEQVQLFDICVSRNIRYVDTLIPPCTSSMVSQDTIILIGNNVVAIPHMNENILFYNIELQIAHTLHYQHSRNYNRSLSISSL